MCGAPAMITAAHRNCASRRVARPSRQGGRVAKRQDSTSSAISEIESSIRTQASAEFRCDSNPNGVASRPHRCGAHGRATLTWRRSRRFYNRQQVGLHGGASLGGQADVMGSERPVAIVGGAVSLNSFSTEPAPQCGQTARSPARISSSKSCSQAVHRNSNSGMPGDPLEIAVTVRVGRSRRRRPPLTIDDPRAACRNRLQSA